MALYKKKTTDEPMCMVTAFLCSYAVEVLFQTKKNLNALAHNSAGSTQPELWVHANL